MVIMKYFFYSISFLKFNNLDVDIYGKWIDSKNISFNIKKFFVKNYI